MNSKCLRRNARYSGCVLLVFLIVLLFVFPLRQNIAQTNLTQSGFGQTNAPNYWLPAPTDFQRLQYYYAAYQGSPAPGTEHGVFTLRADNTWSGDWNSNVVPMPTRAQLGAITSQQVDLFQRAAVFTNSTWQIITSLTNIPLRSLNLSASSYAQIRAAAQYDKLVQQCQRLGQLQTVAPATRTP